MERPDDYGRWWHGERRDDAWYQQIYSQRSKAHGQFIAWVNDHGPFASMLEVGCGRGEPYARMFDTNGYHGCDIARPQIEACQRRFPGRRFFVADASKDDLGGPYDLVFSHAVIDHVYDIDAFLRHAASASRGWLYICAYNGWYGDLDRHVYRWVPKVSCFKNQISPSETQRTLEAAGCFDISITPLPVDETAVETVVIARVAARA